VSVACTLEQVFWALVHGQVCTLHRCVFTPTYTSASTLAAGCVHMYIFTYMCICMLIYMDAYVHLWYCLTRWGQARMQRENLSTKIFSLHTCAYAYVCICVCMYAFIGACVYVSICICVCLCICLYVYVYVCVYVFIYIYMHARVGVHMHSCRRLLFICTVQSLCYMRV